MPETKPKPKPKPKSRPRTMTELELRSAYLNLEELHRRAVESNRVLVDTLQRLVSAWTTTRDLDAATADAQRVLDGIDMRGQMRVADAVLKNARMERMALDRAKGATGTH